MRRTSCYWVGFWGIWCLRIPKGNKIRLLNLTKTAGACQNIPLTKYILPYPRPVVY